MQSDPIQVDDSDNEDDSSDKEDESVSGPESHYGSTHSTRSRSHELIHSSTTSIKSGDEVEEGYASSESNETLKRSARSTHRRRSLSVIVSSDSEDESDTSAQPLKGAARNRTRMIITSSSTSSDASEDDDASGKESEPDSETRGRRARGGGRIPAQTTTRPSNPVGYHSSSEDEDEDDVEGNDESEDEEEEEYEPQEPATSSPGYQAPNPEQNDMADNNVLISLMDYGTAAIDRPHRGSRLPAPPIPTSSSEDGDRERYEEGDADEPNTDNEGPSSDRGSDSDHSDYYGS